VAEKALVKPHCPTHLRPLTVHGECPICEALIARAESAGESVRYVGESPDEARYERWLDTIGGSR
jgi:hypothetical protein